ncbi:RimK family alpha-L-glutamate ligase [Candidatus Saccharibacteria bacterium]|nr:RimK family alpha-L-glutamate ligase [Candidatus Saccharibacteria bacterium]
MKLAILTRLPHYYTERRLVEEAEKRGHWIETIRYPACYVSLTSEGSEVLYKGEKLSPYDAVISRSFAGSSTYGTAILRQFEVMGSYAPIKSLAINRSIDTLRTMQILTREGVSVPKTVFVREPDQADELIEYVGLPAVVRVASMRRENSVLAETRKAVSSVIRAFYVNDATFMLQEYINGETVQYVRAIVVGSSVVASVRKNSSAFASEANDTGDTKFDKIAVLSDESKKVAVKAAKAIGLNICSVDLMVSDGAAKVMTINPYFGIENIEKITKRNVAGKIIEYVELNAKRRTKKDKVGA